MAINVENHSTPVLALDDETVSRFFCRYCTMEGQNNTPSLHDILTAKVTDADMVLLSPTTGDFLLPWF